ncbi:spermatogenesis-associated protein 25 [Moschus berezovskii]|uniref:spermatogenesis-associated protein 25 n=1 Tax=Moschus berezovskii TaxID=68408 RepID=UPI0024438580|nr:spermatogenesis-associated protein 25 [Moschus berezovskii]
MSYFMSPQIQPGLPSSGRGGAASPGPSLGLHSPMEPGVAASGGQGPLSQKAERVMPAAQAWGPAPGGAGWEPARLEHNWHGYRFPARRQPESLGRGHSCSGSRAQQRGSPSRPAPLLLCGLSPGAPLMPAEARGKAASSQPDICILTLAMMIAGIPTVPVPGLREEDLIRAAQAFMMAHPEPEGAVEGTQWAQVQTRTASGPMALARSRRGQPPGSYL